MANEIDSLTFFIVLVFFSSFADTADKYYNELAHHMQLPVMQLPEGAQSLSNPKNVSSFASPSLTTSLINNNCLLTFRDIMMQRQFHHQQQQQQQQHQNQRHQQYLKNEHVEEYETAKPPQTISAPLSPNSLHKLSPPIQRRHAEKLEKATPMNSSHNDSVTRENCEDAKRSPPNNGSGGCGKTVREELEASRKLLKTGE